VVHDQARDDYNDPKVKNGITPKLARKTADSRTDTTANH
jgi:hypothetical protein